MDCGEPVVVEARCAAGHRVGLDDLVVSTDGPFGLADPRPPDEAAEPVASGDTTGGTTKAPGHPGAFVFAAGVVSAGWCSRRIVDLELGGVAAGGDDLEAEADLAQRGASRDPAVGDQPVEVRLDADGAVRQADWRQERQDVVVAGGLDLPGVAAEVHVPGDDRTRGGLAVVVGPDHDLAVAGNAVEPDVVRRVVDADVRGAGRPGAADRRERAQPRLMRRCSSCGSPCGRSGRS